MALSTIETGKPSPVEASPKALLGVIDIGSNTIRMAIAQVMADGRIQILEQLQRAVRLGQDTFQKGQLSSETLRESVAILRDFRHLLDTYGVESIRAVATTAIREARNGDTFVDRVLMATGLEVSPITVAEESRLMVAAVRQVASDLLVQSQGTLIVEVGGGSTLLNILEKGELIQSQSLPLGTVRMMEALSLRGDTAEHTAQLIRNEVSSAFNAFKSTFSFKQIQTFIALGGDVRWAARQTDPTEVVKEIQCLSKEYLKRLIERCQQYTADELSHHYGMPFADAETLIPALLVYQGLLNATKARTILVPQVSMRDGLLWDLALSVMGNKDETLIHQCLKSAKTIAKKYRVDLEHAQCIMELATRIFDCLQDRHHMNDRHRLLMQVAALLHEIGTFVSTRSHHKHSMYIITHSELFGLTQDEVAMVANIARYHRRSRPKPSHSEYMSMPRERRLIVNKLAAILRVADALDISHSQQLRDIEMQIKKQRFVIHNKGRSDLTLEKKSLAGKGDMFEDIYGLQVQIEQQY